MRQSESTASLLVAALLASLFLAACSKKDVTAPAPHAGLPPEELSRACWIWNRRSPLTPEEAAALRSAGITRLYWHTADIVWVSKAWQFPQENPEFAPPAPDGFERVPVIRLAATPDTAANPGRFPLLGQFIAGLLEKHPAEMIQIDYDCPDSLLGKYAELLGHVRAAAQPGRLSITALAGWADKPGFDRVEAQADEIAVMFYDLRADLPADITAGNAHPMVDLDSIRATLPKWRAQCRKPWLAGFPNFARLSLFDAAGLLAGHKHAWNWDTLVFHPELEITRLPRGDGITWLAAKQPGSLVDNVSAVPGQVIVLRQPTSEALRESVRLAAESGATGVVWFPLPEPDAGTGFTASHLGALVDDNAAPASANLTLTRDPTTGTLVLANAGPYDLPPRFEGIEGATDRGWQLEIDGGTAPAFLDAAPGAFVQMLGHTSPDTPDPPIAPVPSAQCLTFWFAALPAGGRTETGPIRLNPDATLHWRLGGGEWRELASSNDF